MEQESRLKKIRLKAGFSVRELARQLDINHSTILFWEKNNMTPRSEVLLPMANILGASVDEILGGKRPKTKRIGGKAKQAFDKVSKLPHSQQKKIVDVVEALVTQYQN